MLKFSQMLFKKRVMKVRVEGPIDIKNQSKILKQLEHVQKKKIDSLIVIINSYGGSLRVAKNISDCLKGITRNQIPIYCFAEQFCLNSANLILTAGSQCYASKLSVIGDFGYADERYDLSDQFKKNWANREKISCFNVPLEIWKGHHQLSSEIDIVKIINSSADQLKSLIIQNREKQMRKQKKNIIEVRGQFLQGGAINPQLAVQQGIIDGILNYHRFIKEKLRDHRIVEGEDDHQYRAINFFRSGLEVFKQQ